MTYETTIGRDFTGADGEIMTQEIRITIEAGYHRASRGQRDSLGGVRGAGPPIEPDDDEGIEIESAKDVNGIEIELTEKENERIEEEMLKIRADAAIDYSDTD